MVISEGPDLLVVPDVAGLPGSEALSVLAQSGLRWVETGEVSDDVPAGQVIRTEPGAGGGVAATEQVVVVISEGPDLLVVPDVVGLPSVEAYANLTVLGLAWVEVVEPSDTVVVGGVIRTEPAAGEQVAAGGEVVVVISGGSEGVTTTDTTVPDTAPSDEDTETPTG